MRTLLLLGVLLGALNAYGKKHCVCEVYDYQKEEKYYRMGCKIWFGQQKKCDSKEIVKIPYYKNLWDFVPNLEDGDELVAGFVGHWPNADFTMDFVKEDLEPLANKNRIKVTYENTACSPMDDPEAVQKFLNNNINIQKGSSILVKGSQGISIGLWDILYAGKANFYAYASTEWSSPGYVACNTIENKGCMGKYQAYESGVCVDTKKENQKVRLTCLSKNGGRKHTWQRR